MALYCWDRVDEYTDGKVGIGAAWHIIPPLFFLVGVRHGMVYGMDDCTSGVMAEMR